MATLEQNKVHIFDIGRGALMEEVSSQLEKVAENLYDRNTPHKPTRKLTVELELSIDERREIVDVKAHTKTTLAPSKPVETRLTFGKERGGWGASEVSVHTPGQMSLDGSVEPPPALIAVGGGKTPEPAPESTHTEERIEENA